jgi:hypothetical protein
MEMVLTITMAPDGTVSVNGPIQNRVLCYGMLEAAKEAVHQFGEKQQQLVQPVTIMPPRPNGRG